MKTKILYTIMVLALCFGFKAQGQTNQVMLLKDRLNTLSEKEKEHFNFLRSGTPFKLYFTKDNGSFYNWESENGIKVVELESSVFLDSLISPKYIVDFRSVEMLILNLKSEELELLKEDFFSQFGSLQYIQIRSYDSISETQTRSIFRDITIPERVQIIIEKLEEPS